MGDECMIYEKKFEYFICYSGKDINLDNKVGYGWNWEFAYTLFSELTAADKEVYFASENGQNDAYRDRDTLARLIRGVSAFIILVTPNFFNEFDPNDPENPITLELDIALEVAKERGAGFLRYVHMPNFRWYSPFVKRVQERYSEEEYPFNRYFDVAGHRCALRENPKERAKDFLWENLGIDVRQEERRRKYGRDVELCFHSVVTHTQGLSLPDTFEEETAKFGLHWSKPGHSYYWPVFFGDAGMEDKAQDGVSTCAVCFGVLQLMHWNERDRWQHKEKEHREFFRQTEEYFLNICRDVLSLLVVMREPNGKWPAMKKFGGELLDCDEQDGGLNQTTLSLSTLLKSGFLEKRSENWGEVDDSVLAVRYEYIIESIRWLLDRADEDQGYMYWSADDDRKGPPVIGSSFLTAICVDTLIKFANQEYVIRRHDPILDEVKRCFKKIIPFFTELKSYDSGMKTELQGQVSSFSHTAKVLNSLCTLRDFALRHAANDALYTDLSDDADLLIGECFNFLMKQLEDPESPMYFSDRLLAEKCKHEVFIAPYDRRRKQAVEYYELNGELLAVTAFIKIFRDDELAMRLMGAYYGTEGNKRLIQPDMEVLKKRLINRVFEYFDSYSERDEHVRRFFDRTAAKSILVKGRRSGEEYRYPIYVLYYYRMALTELVTLFGSGKAEEKPSESLKETA